MWAYATVGGAVAGRRVRFLWAGDAHYRTWLRMLPDTPYEEPSREALEVVRTSLLTAQIR